MSLWSAAITALTNVGFAEWNALLTAGRVATFETIPIGGSRSEAIPTGGGYQDAANYLAGDFELPDSASAGGTWKLIVEMRTENAGTTVTPRLRNITDSSDTWVSGSPATSTAWGTTQTSTALTLSTGKKYRLQFSKSDDAVQAWGIGKLQRVDA